MKNLSKLFVAAMLLTSGITYGQTTAPQQPTTPATPGTQPTSPTQTSPATPPQDPQAPVKDDLNSTPARTPRTGNPSEDTLIRGDKKMDTMKMDKQKMEGTGTGIIDSTAKTGGAIVPQSETKKRKRP